jgi:hypothetical protein
MKNSSVGGVKVYNFGIPAFRSSTGLMTCPMAGACAAGCYAKSGAYLWGTVKNAYEKRLEATLATDFVDQVSAELERILKSTKTVVVRIHDSGDFYSMEYFKKWLTIMAKYPDVQFYAYTKMVKMLKGSKIPANFTLIFSMGGKQDSLIEMNSDRHSRVFNTLKELKLAGYVDTSKNDLLAIGKNKKIGLVYHGAKSYQNTLWGKVKSEAVV